MIFLGTAGIPHTAKDSNTAGGVKAVSKLGLQAMEIAFVRNVYLNSENAKEVGKVARKFNVKLSIHAPYFINLCSTDKKVLESSKRRIFDSASRAEDMGANIVVVHSAYYGNLNSNEAINKISSKLKDLVSQFSKTKIGIETAGRLKQFGTLDEVIDLCRKVECIPVVDFAHVYVRNNGKINYSEIFDKIENFGLKHLHSHFEGVKWDGEKFVDVHEPISDNPPFKPLAEEILKRKINITIICESPVLENDSLKMKGILEKLGHRF